MKKQVIISQKAEDDLARIYAYLWKEYDFDVAERFRMRAEKALFQLGQHSDIGPNPAWATVHYRLRFWIISKTNYIIYYESQADTVSIERVLTEDVMCTALSSLDSKIHRKMPTRVANERHP